MVIFLQKQLIEQKICSQPIAITNIFYLKFKFELFQISSGVFTKTRRFLALNMSFDGKKEPVGALLNSTRTHLTLLKC